MFQLDYHSLKPSDTKILAVTWSGSSTIILGGTNKSTYLYQHPCCLGPPSVARIAFAKLCLCPSQLTSSQSSLAPQNTSLGHSAPRLPLAMPPYYACKALFPSVAQWHRIQKESCNEKERKNKIFGFKIHWHNSKELC